MELHEFINEKIFTDDLISYVKMNGIYHPSPNNNRGNGFSWYNTDKKDYLYTPINTLRLSEHWNYESQIREVIKFPIKSDYKDINEYNNDYEYYDYLYDVIDKEYIKYGSDLWRFGDKIIGMRTTNNAPEGYWNIGIFVDDATNGNKWEIIESFKMKNNTKYS